MSRRVLAILLLLVGGVCLWPLEQRLTADRRLYRYGRPSVTVKLRDQISQNTALALLAGFRAIVADFLWIQSHGFWEQHQWVRQYRNMELATTLQPQSVVFWDFGSWHMAWNIAYAERIDPANLTKAQGLKRERIWIERARQFLVRGLENNPNRYELYFSLGWLYWRKLDDRCAALPYFEQAARFADAPSYTERLYVRCLETCRSPQLAYDYWRQRWHGGNPATFKDRISARGVIERELRRLENLLNIPPEQRIFPPTPPAPPAAGAA